MEPIYTKPIPGGIHIEGFPDAVKFIKLDGPKARRLADLSLHASDLRFTVESLEALNVAGIADHVRESLWRSAIFHFIKCFDAGDSRFSLQPAQVFKNTPPATMMNFDHFKDIRNKHLAHDENAYAQSATGALLNNGRKKYKIEKIISTNVYVQTLEQDSYSNFRILIERARTWVSEQYDVICAQLTQELEAMPHEKLLAMPEVSGRVPTLDERSKSRKPRNAKVRRN